MLDIAFFELSEEIAGQVSRLNAAKPLQMN